jgi:truncated hemoglobin YjbI
MSANASVYDLLSGDRQGMLSVTGAFYVRVLADEMLAPYFAGVEMSRQSLMLAEFLAMAFGGPHAYSGRHLRAAHAGLPGLTDAHFDRVVAHLATALREHGIADGDVATVVAVAETVRSDVLSR